MRTMVFDSVIRHAGRVMPASEATAPVSVVIPCYRCADTIGDAVASVAAQTQVPRQVVLVDDASGDGTAGTLHALAATYPQGWIEVIELPHNQGPSRARNAGWERATQEYIAFLDSDDTWASTKLELQLRALREDPSIVLISHPMPILERDAPKPAPPRSARTRIVGRRRLLLNNPFPTPSVVLRRDLPYRFDEKFRRVEDFLLWGQIAFSGYRCAKLDAELGYLHKPCFGASGLSGDLKAMHRAGREVRRELLRQGLVSLPEHCFARSVGLLRKSRQRLLLAWRRANAKATP